MIIKYEIEPIDFLRDDSWECDDLYDDIVNSDKETEFNAYIEDVFPNGANPTELNDYCRFNSQDIREMLGISDDDDDEEEKKIKLKKSGDFDIINCVITQKEKT